MIRYWSEEDSPGQTAFTLTCHERPPLLALRDDAGSSLRQGLAPQVPWDLVKAMSELGFMGVLVPQEYGGSGLGYVARTILLEEISRISATAAFMLQIFHLGIGPMIDFGTPEQKQKYLPALATGKLLSTVGSTEATGGSDPASGHSTARLEENTYILNGRKIFITSDAHHHGPQGTCIDFLAALSQQLRAIRYCTNEVGTLNIVVCVKPVPDPRHWDKIKWTTVSLAKIR